MQKELLKVLPTPKFTVVFLRSVCLQVYTKILLPSYYKKDTMRIKK